MMIDRICINERVISTRDAFVYAAAIMRYYLSYKPRFAVPFPLGMLFNFAIFSFAIEHRATTTRSSSRKSQNDF